MTDLLTKLSAVAPSVLHFSALVWPEIWVLYCQDDLVLGGIKKKDINGIFFMIKEISCIFQKEQWK